MQLLLAALCALAALLLFSSSAYGASPGLPFTEDFSDTTLKDTSLTDANWSMEEQAVVLAWRKKFFGTTATGTAIGNSDVDQTLAIALGDVDGDGDLDIVAGNLNQTNKLYLNDGDSAPFDTIVNGTAIGSSDVDDTYAIALGDVDGDGDPVVSDYAQFLIESETEATNHNTDSGEIVWQPDIGEDTAHVTLIAGAPGHPELDSAPGPIYTVRPESVYDEPQRVWLPLPYGTDPDTIGIYYYHPNGDDRGWYPAENVLGWLVPDSALTLDLDLDSVRYLGLLVRHAAIIHIGEPKRE